MVTLDWETDRTDGVTHVRLFVTAEYRCRVRIENRLDGPVWPPRRQGQPAAGWDGDEFAAVVDPDDRLVVGYATPADPADPPAEVVSEEPVDGDASSDDGATASDGTCWSGGAPGDATGTTDTVGSTGTTDGGAPADGGTVPDGGDPVGGDDLAGVAGSGLEDVEGTDLAGVEGCDPDSVDVESTPAGVVRDLGDPIVPRDAVPFPDPEEVRPDRDLENSPATPDESQSGTARSEWGSALPPESDPAADALVVPGPVRAWLRDVERRLDALDHRETDPGTGRPSPTLTGAVAADRHALASVARRVDALATRAASGGDGSGRDTPHGDRRDADAGGGDRPLADGGR